MLKFSQLSQFNKQPAAQPDALSLSLAVDTEYTLGLVETTSLFRAKEAGAKSKLQTALLEKPRKRPRSPASVFPIFSMPVATTQKVAMTQTSVHGRVRQQSACASPGSKRRRRSQSRSSLGHAFAVCTTRAVGWAHKDDAVLYHPFS